MDLNEYQEKAQRTCMPSCDNFSYMAMNLVGEVGEFTSKIGKAIRKGQLSINENKIRKSFQGDALSARRAEAEFNELLQKEAGDILWQLSGLCHVLGWKLDDIARANLEKLASRQFRGVIDGDGDKR